MNIRYNIWCNILFWLLMLIAGQDPVASPPGWMMIAQWMIMKALVMWIKSLYHSLLHLECLDQLYSSCRILDDVPDFMQGIKESLQRALDALHVPTPGPSPDGISTHEAIQVSSVNSTSKL
jgi:hypothetical protein